MVKVPVPPHKNDARAPDRGNIWFSAPALWTVIGSLVTAAFGAGITGFSNYSFERQKFQSELIRKALEAPDNMKKADGLKFLANAGLIDKYKDEVLATLPTFLGAAIRDHFITLGDVKYVLAKLGMHKGPFDEVADEAFRGAR